MKKIELNELKRIEFQLLMQFKKVCDNNNYNYSLLAGTLLGAVRHKGFIPWDDDIDVMMPRNDYNKFEEYCISNKLPFVLLSNKTEAKYGYLHSKIYNPNTFTEELITDRYNLKSGVFIDIFIYDGFGNEKKESKKNYKKSALLRELLVASNWKKYKKSKTHSWVYEPIRFILFVLSRCFSFKWLIKKIQLKYSKFSFEKSLFVGNLSSDSREKSIIERSNFDSYVELEFEGEKFKAFKGYEIYLRTMYGDYMKLPPLEKRVSHHTFDAYWKE